jgi:pyruvate carboxylase
MTVKITDTTMRDGHQSLLATRMHISFCHSERRPRSRAEERSLAKESGAGQTRERRSRDIPDLEERPQP